MIFKLLPSLFIILVSAYANEYEEIFDLSTTNTPTSFESNKVQDYSEESKYLQDEQIELVGNRSLLPALKRFSVLQYAPLNQPTKNIDHNEIQNSIKPPEDNSEQKTAIVSVNTGRHVYTGKEHKHNHLEPQPLKEDESEYQQSYRSFVSGHNVEGFPETTGYYLERGEDPVVTKASSDHQSQKVRPAKFVYYQKTKENFLDNKVLVDKPPATQDFKFLEFLPADLGSAAKAAHKKSLPYTYSLHNLLAQEKQMQTYAHPRLHLNIARSYNIAKQIQQAQESRLPPMLAQKSLTNLILHPLHPHNTIMLPVKTVLGL